MQQMLLNTSSHGSLPNNELDVQSAVASPHEEENSSAAPREDESKDMSDVEDAEDSRMAEGQAPVHFNFNNLHPVESAPTAIDPSDPTPQKRQRIAYVDLKQKEQERIRIENLRHRLEVRLARGWKPCIDSPEGRPASGQGIENNSQPAGPANKDARRICLVVR
jgi:hypothetical protein